MVNQELEIRPNTYYTLEETAALLRVSRGSIRELLEKSDAALVLVDGKPTGILTRQDLLAHVGHR